jgi:hypothetical protein
VQDAANGPLSFDVFMVTANACSIPAIIAGGFHIKTATTIYSANFSSRFRLPRASSGSYNAHRDAPAEVISSSFTLSLRSPDALQVTFGIDETREEAQVAANLRPGTVDDAVRTTVKMYIERSKYLHMYLSSGPLDLG